jgi:uncharacterized protein (DUF2384 family)
MNGGFGSRRRTGPVLPREASVRQGQAVRAAMDAFSDGAAASSFLNSHHDGLGARPLDLAVESDDGLKAVEAAIATESRLKEGNPMSKSPTIAPAGGDPA